jgi:hypothetical protein
MRRQKDFEPVEALDRLKGQWQRNWQRVRLSVARMRKLELAIRRLEKRLAVQRAERDATRQAARELRQAQRKKKPNTVTCPHGGGNEPCPICEGPDRMQDDG